MYSAWIPSLVGYFCYGGREPLFGRNLLRLRLLRLRLRLSLT